MGDVLPRFKAAAVQAAPIYLDREDSVEKACVLIETAGRNRAEVVALPEVFIPGNPHWAWYTGLRKGLDLSTELFLNSVEIPSEATVRIEGAAARYGTYVVIGINERENKTLYNTLLFSDNKGQIIANTGSSNRRAGKTRVGRGRRKHTQGLRYRDWAPWRPDLR